MSAAVNTVSIQGHEPTDDELLSRFRPVFARIAAGAIDRENSGRRPIQEVDWLKTSGFTALRVPQYLGGAGASLRQLHLLLIELAAADSNLSHALRVHFRFVEGVWAKRDLPWSERWLRRIAAGTVVAAGSAERTGDPRKPSTTIRRHGGQHLINGTKYYSTGSIYADYVSVTATTEAGEMATVLVPTNAPGVEVIDDWVGFGQRSSGSGTTVFRNTPVDEQDVLPPAANAAARFAHVQLSHLATTAGIVQRATEEIVAFVKGRQRTYPQASGDVASNDPLIQSVVGRADAAVYALQAIVLQVASSLDALANAQWALRTAPKASVTAEWVAAVEKQEIQAGIDAYRAQTVVLDLALKTTGEIFEVGGSSAVDRARHLDRHWRNVRTLASHNPLIYRQRQLGEFQLNGNPPHNFNRVGGQVSEGATGEDAALGV